MSGSGLSLRKRLTLLMVTLVVFAGGIAVVTLNFIEPVIVDGVTSSLEASAEIEATRIEAILSDARFSAFRAGGMPEIGQLIDGVPQPDLADKLAMTAPELSTITVLADDAVLISTEDGPHPELIEDLGPDETFNWGTAYLSSSGEPRVPMVWRILREREGDFFLVADVDLRPIQDLLLAYEGSGDTSEAHIAQLLPNGDAQFITPLRFDREAAFDRTVPAGSDVPIMTAIRGDETTLVGIPDYRGVPSVLALRQVEPLGWGLVVKTDEAEALFVRRQLRITATAAVGIALIGMIALMWLGLRGYERRIAKITEIARAVRDGDFGKRVQDNRGDELGVIARSFDEAADAMENALANRNAFVASVSHELRTPLTGVVGLASAMADPSFEMDESELRDTAAIVADQSLELSALVDDLLTAARVEAGNLEITTKAFDAVDIVKSALTDQPDFAPALDYSESDLLVLADPYRTQQILRNLISNAQRYGGARAQIEIRDVDGFVEIDVIDDGAGVPDGAEERIFAPFERAHSQLGVTGSVGLGLKISRDLAELMDGELLYLREQENTIFKLRLPASGQRRLFASQRLNST